MIDPNSYAPPNKEIREAVDRLDEQVTTDRGIVQQKLGALLKQKIPLELAEEAILDQCTRTYVNIATYDRFDEWNEREHPPRVGEEDWIGFDHMDGAAELRKYGSKLMRGYDYCVYCIECELKQESLRELQLRAKELFNDELSCSRQLYNADRVFYVGQTSDFGRRLQSHGVGRMREHHPPSRVTRLSKLLGAGVVYHSQSRKDVEKYEEYYGENFSDIVEDDCIFVYFS